MVPDTSPGGRTPSSSEPDAVLSEAEDDWSESVSGAATGKPSGLDPSAGPGTTGHPVPPLLHPPHEAKTGLTQPEKHRPRHQSPRPCSPAR